MSEATLCSPTHNLFPIRIFRINLFADAKRAKVSSSPALLTVIKLMEEQQSAICCICASLSARGAVTSIVCRRGLTLSSAANHLQHVYGNALTVFQFASSAAKTFCNGFAEPLNARKYINFHRSILYRAAFENIYASAFIIITPVALPLNRTESKSAIAGLG